jgi:hypothetical protein
MAVGFKPIAINKTNKIMKERLPLSPAGKLIAAGLATAVAGVIIQIVSGHPYPKVPPVFFILLIPAGLIVFVHRRWTPILTIIAGVFLINGLFGSGAYVRLFNLTNAGDSIGLWIQTIGVFGATVAGIVAIIQNYSVKNT